MKLNDKSFVRAEHFIKETHKEAELTLRKTVMELANKVLDGHSNYQFVIDQGIDDTLYKTYKQEAYVMVKGGVRKFLENNKYHMSGADKRSIKRAFEIKAFLETADKEMDLSLT